MAGYGWDEYDVRKGGRQTIHDAGNAIDITINFVKVPGGRHGGSWAARVKGVPRENAPADLYTTMIFYAGMEGLGSLRVDNAEDHPQGFDGDVKLKGFTPELGDFTIDVTKGPESNEYPSFSHPVSAEKPLDQTFVATLEMPQEHLWQAKSTPTRLHVLMKTILTVIAIMFASMKTYVDSLLEKYKENTPPAPQVFTLPNIPGEGDIHYVQKVFEGAFEFDILFSSGSAPSPVTCKLKLIWNGRLNACH
jgi:mannosyl-oligosaccharide glucosidase